MILQFGKSSLMGLLKASLFLILYCVFSPLCFRAKCYGSESSVKFLKAPHAFSHLNSAKFVFEVLEGGNVTSCSNCSLVCKLDNGNASNCETKKVFYSGLPDGYHTLEVCSKEPGGFGCASYNWTIDTVPPTAYITASMSFTNASNVSVVISFSEPCIGGGGFGCPSVNACNLLVYGAGQVIPSSFNILRPNLIYSLVVSLSPTIQYGRAILVMDKEFCTDNAGNSFTRTENSSLYVHFDRRTAYVDLRTKVPERLFQLNRETRMVQATNNSNNLKVYLYFSSPVQNSSAEIMKSLNISQGSLSPTGGNNLGNRRFGFLISNISGVAIITAGLNSNSILTRQGTPISPVAPVTFLYDSKRPSVKLSTYNMRTTEDILQVLIKFIKPVFDFNSSHVSISGGHLKSFQKITRRTYSVEVQADDDHVSVNVPENVTADVAGNRNLASNILQVRHYSVPLLCSVISAFVTASFMLTSLVASLLTLSTACLQSVGAFTKASSLTVEPTRNLFRIICHIQVFALSRWLAVILPVEYYELSRSLRWSVPYFGLPWESTKMQPILESSSPFGSSSSYLARTSNSVLSQNLQSEAENLHNAASVYGLPLTPAEYRTYFESQTIVPEAEYILSSQSFNGWSYFTRSMFWFALIGGCLILLHAFFLCLLKLRKRNPEKQRGYGALTFPRFEIFLTILALPGICKASVAVIQGGKASEMVAGILLLLFVASMLLALFLFLSVGITYGKLLQYKEVHQEGRKFHWYQEIIRVTLGPGKRGQWTWKNPSDSLYLTIFGPLYEDLRGPPKYMLSQISGGNPWNLGDPIIDSEDETEDAEAPFIQKLFGILRIYYTLLESIRRVTLGILVGAYTGIWSSETPTIIMLCISSFQLFFLVLKKPFIKKKTQLVEIISVSSEVGLFATCVVLLKKEFPISDESKIGMFMVIIFLVGYSAQLASEWYALYRQTRLLDPNEKSFTRGLKIGCTGLLFLVLPQKMVRNLESWFPANGGESGGGGGATTSRAERCRSSGSRSSSGSTDKPWMKQLRELAKASFSKEENRGPNDPSTSRTTWSGIWGTKRNGSTSLKSSSDFKTRDFKQKGLYKDLEAIFASK